MIVLGSEAKRPPTLPPKRSMAMVAKMATAPAPSAERRME